MSATNGRLALTRAEVCESVGISESTLRRVIQSGDLVERRLGSKRLIRVADLEAWLDSLPESGRTS